LLGDLGKVCTIIAYPCLINGLLISGREEQDLINLLRIVECTLFTAQKYNIGLK